MYFVYIIFSPSRNKFYVGSSSDPEGRLQKHNTNHVGFTGKTGDWEMKFREDFVDKDHALKREKQIKGWKSRLMIEKLIASQS